MPTLPAPDRTIPLDPATALRGFGGSFRDPALEAAFEQHLERESFRNARVLMVASIVLNLLFLFSDWRFLGTPHFWVAVPARLLVVALALATFLVLPRLRGVQSVQRAMAAWMVLNALPVAALVTSRSEIALAITFMLPALYYMCVPVRFAWTLGCGAFTSLAMLVGLGIGGVEAENGPGLVLAMVMLNTGLAISVTRANRLDRTTWLAVRAEAQLRAELGRSRATLERLFDACPVPLVLTDRAAGTMLRMSDSCAELIGTAAPTTLLRLGGAAEAPSRLETALAAGAGEAEFEVEIATPERGALTLLVKATAIDVDGRDAVLAGLVDITRRKAEQTSLERLASTDALTGLRNRLSFFAAGRAEMLRASRARSPIALLMIDIDHFKRINDSRGHSAGDAALRAFAALCGETLGPRAVIGRLGGEEFGVLLPHTGLSAAALVAEDLCAAAAALAVDGGAAEPVRLTVSIGVAAIHAQDRDIDGALARADLALYAAKRGGRNQVTVDQADDGRLAV